MKKGSAHSLLKHDIQVYSLNEQAVTIVFGNEIAEGLLQRITAYNTSLQVAPFPGFRSTVPAYSTLTVYYDPLIVMRTALQGHNCFEKVSNYLKTISDDTADHQNLSSRLIIPVCYDQSLGLDLAEVAQITKLSIEELIRLHSAVVYTVYMIGFIPGFAYLGGMDERLACSRKSTPRAAVPAGAVGIAGKQTGIYPLTTPGGWQIIGQTPEKLFDINRPLPSLLKAGDEVVFKPIDLDEFRNLQQRNTGLLKENTRLLNENTRLLNENTRLLNNAATVQLEDNGLLNKNTAVPDNCNQPLSKPIDLQDE